MSDKVYGICENKCLKELYDKNFIDQTITAANFEIDALGEQLVANRFISFDIVDVSTIASNTSYTIISDISNYVEDNNYDFSYSFLDKINRALVIATPVFNETNFPAIPYVQCTPFISGTTLYTTIKNESASSIKLECVNVRFIWNAA